MNLKKLVRLAILLPVMALGCMGQKPHKPIMALNSREEWKSDEQLIQNIWKEVVKITEINPNTPIPPIIFLEETDPKALGRFLVENNKVKIKIFLGSIQKLVKNARDVYQQSGGTHGYGIGH